MQNVLLNHPMPNVKMDHVISPQILRLLKDRTTKDMIIQLTNLTEDQLCSDIETLIKTGQPVLQTDLAYLSLIDFKALKQIISEKEIDLTNVTEVLMMEIETEYICSTNHQIDSGFTRLGLVYHAVRFHLNRLNVPYVDCDENVLLNAEQLIIDGRQDTLNTTYQTDRQYRPYHREHPFMAPSLIELFFCDSVHYAESEDEYDYNESEHLGSVDSAESNDSDAESEAVESDSEEDSETADVSATDLSSDESATDISSDESEADYDNERGSYSRKRRRVMNQ